VIVQLQDLVSVPGADVLHEGVRAAVGPVRAVGSGRVRALKMAGDSWYEEPVVCDVALLLGVVFCSLRGGGWLVGLSAVCWWRGADFPVGVIGEDVVVVDVLVEGAYFFFFFLGSGGVLWWWDHVC